MNGPGEQIVFLQNRPPRLESGDFTVTVTQKVTIDGVATEQFSAEQEFFVTGLRYTLPPAAIASVFPPDGNQGEFSNVLPHVVLAQPTLPWQRSLGAGVAGRPTWLAVLLFDEADPPPAPAQRTIADLASSGGVLFPARDREPGEQTTDPVTTIDVPLALFNAIAPSAADLQWLAHVRETEAPPGGSGPSDNAVVFGNRLPAAGAISTAHLVALEGYAPYLPANDGTPSAAIPAGTTAVRVVSLASWTFTAIDLHETFQEMLTPPQMTPAPLQRPVANASSGDASADAAVQNALGMGYTALDHALQNGDSTVSWYRGPLVPLGSPPDAEPPYANADAQVRFDPTTGMLDVSRAAAWQLGRLLALHDLAFATALYRWKLGRTADAVNALEQEIIESELPAPAQGTPADAAPGARLAQVAKTVVAPAAERLARGEG